MPESTAVQHRFVILFETFQFHIPQAFHIIGTQVDAHDSTGLLPESFLKTEDIEIDMILRLESLVSHPIQRCLLVDGAEVRTVSPHIPDTLMGITARLVTKRISSFTKRLA